MACPCMLSQEERDAKTRSVMIDKELNAERDTIKRQVKVLLLGAGESGKSTFLKQMRIIHGEDFDDGARREYIPTIYNNLIKAAKILCQARDVLEIPWGDASNAAHADRILQQTGNVDRPSDFVPYVSALASLWKDSGIQETFERRSEFQIVSQALCTSFKRSSVVCTWYHRLIDALSNLLQGDSTKYFYSRLDEIRQEVSLVVLPPDLAVRGVSGIACVNFALRQMRPENVDQRAWPRVACAVTTLAPNSAGCRL